jgi:hypothetical protein
MIPRVVLTGGPNGGKTTALEELKERLPKLDITPIIVPELATFLYTCGVRWVDVENNETGSFRFQANMIKSQMANEDMLFRFAHLTPGNTKVMICDRGTIDNLVYAKDEWQDDIQSEVGSLGLLKRRYDGIIHLNSRAWGEGYTTENNPARWETRELAQKVDQRTWEMWEMGPKVPHLRVNHAENWETKIETVVRAIKAVTTWNYAPRWPDGTTQFSPGS